MRVLDIYCSKCKRELDDKFIEGFRYNYFALNEKYYFEDMCGEINEMTEKEVRLFFEV